MSSRLQRSFERQILATILLLVGALPRMAVGATADTDCHKLTESEQQPITIAVLYREGEAGRRHLDGILEAHDHAGTPAALLACAYMDEDEGLAMLKRIATSERYHLVLGPTDSGVFTEAAADRELIRQAHTPIISALVTAPVPNRHDGWLFRTNVGIESRAGAIYDHLNDSNFDSISVIYADTAFGRGAEVAFRNELENGPGKDYQAFRFQSENDLRLARRKLDEDRPGAVGIFASREQLDAIHGSIRSIQSGWNAYDPLVFTIVDARITGLNGVHFVSLDTRWRGTDGAQTREPGADDAAPTDLGDDTLRRDEVYGLGYDTAALVFQLMAGGPPDREQWQREFRVRFASWLQQSPREESGIMTGMQFRNRENQAQPLVLTLQNSEITLAPLHREVTRVWQVAGALDIRIVQGADILHRRYGYAPWIALALVALIAGWLTVADLRSWHGGRSRSVVAEFPFIALIAFNVFTATGLFAFLATTKFLRWDSLSAAVLVGLGYTALLKSTVFKSTAGESYGLETLYNRAVDWINDRVMVAKSHREIGAIKFIAYTNSRETLEKTLKNIYRFARTQERCEELRRQLGEEIGKRDHDMEQRMYLAQELKFQWNWRQLQERRFVPSDVTERRMVDPDRIVRFCANFCLSMKSEGAVSRVRERADAELAELKADDVAKAKQAHNEIMAELALTHTKMQRLEVYIRWIFVQYGFRLAPIRETGLTPPDLDWDSLVPSLLERVRIRVRRAWNRVTGSVRRRST